MAPSDAAVRAVAGQLSSIVREHGFIHVWCFPDLDSLIAASMVFEGFRRQGVRVRVSVSPEPPERIDEPMLLIGYPVEVVGEVEARSRAAGVFRGEMPSGLTKIPLVADNASSVAGLVASILSEIMVVPELAVYAVAAAYWRGLDRGRRAEFQGVESKLIELLSMEGFVEGSLTLRLFRWFEEPVETSLEITLDPFIPGVTGRREAVEKLLSSDPRLARMRGQSVKEAGEEQVTALATRLYDEVKRVSRVQRRPSEVIGYAYYSPKLPVKDLRELAYILQVLGEAAGAGYLASLAISPKQVLGYAHYLYYRRVFYGLVEAIEKAHEEGPLQVRRLGPLRLAVLNVEANALGPIEKQLRLLGDVAAEAALAVSSKVLAESILGLHGWRVFREALRKNCLEVEPGSLAATIDEQRCQQL